MTDSVKPEPMTPEKMDGTSLDIAEQRRLELKQLLPGVFTETTGSDGQPVETIDFERLKAELGTFSDVYEGRRERYGMEWPGKRDCMKLIQEPSRATLKPCREESVDFDTTQNLFIEGDNLEVLKLLQKSYYGKVKMIYIDPPYNTGKEFIYPDNYAESLETYLAYAGLVDDDGKKFSTNSATEGRFHTRWLNMLYPRLYLSRNLLSSDGILFISIDDNEVEGLRRICNEIFGEENFIACAVWQKRTGPDSRTNLGAAHDYILIYGRNAEASKSVLNKLPLKESRVAAYKNPDNDPRGPWASENLTGQTGHATDSQFYTVETPSGARYQPPEGRCWALSESTFLKLKEDGRIWFGESGGNRPRLKRFLSETDGMMAWTWWPNDEVGHNQEGTKEVKELLGSGDIFDNPKPTRLIDRMLALSTSKEGLVLDFFSGSCSTAHSVLKANSADGGKRRFIMIQLPEVCEEKSEAFKAGFKTISDIGKERIRRAARKIGSALDENFDGGFKVFELDRSNFKSWSSDFEELVVSDLVSEMERHVDHVGEHATQETILYELLLKAGFMPTEAVGRLDLAGKQVFSVAEDALLICLEEQLTSELIDAVADREPMQFICLDKGFKGNDQLKANAVQTFKSRSQGAETEMVFKVV